MLGKLVFKLVLVMIWNTAAASARQCSQSIPGSCMSNTNIRIVRRNDHYDLQLCSNSRCIPAVEEKWIRCNKMCAACKAMANASYCGTNEEDCERRVSMFLDDYCSSNTPSTNIQTVTTTQRIRVTPHVLTTTNIQVVTTVLPRQTATHTTTVHVTVSPTCTIIIPNIANSTQIHTINMKTLQDASNKCELSAGSASGAPTAVLGVLFGLSMILLTTGWVWALLLVTKKYRKQSTSNAATTNATSTTVPHVELNDNPAYETKTLLQRNLAYEDCSSTRVEASIPEQTYDVIQPATNETESEEIEDEYQHLNRALTSVTRSDS